MIDLKQMAYDTIEAHQETIADLRTQLAKANERVRVLEGELNQSYDSFIKGVELGVFHAGSNSLNKFAIKKKIEGVNDFCATIQGYEDVQPIGANYVTSVAAHRDSFIEQLRKEQASE